jgi:hypothetical protein
MLLPSIIGLSVAAISSGFILSAVGYYTPLMLLGSAMMAIGFGFLTTFQLSTTHAAWIGWQVMLGVGTGLSFPQPWSAIQTTLAEKDVPLGLAGVGFAISLAAAVSISICQNVFTNLLRRDLQAGAIPGVDAGHVIQQGATGFLQDVADNEKSSVLVVYNSAVTSCFWLPVAAACVAFVAALGMKWNSVKEKKKDDGAADAEKDKDDKDIGTKGEPVA